MTQLGTWRQGYDAPARIATSGVMMLEATAVPPAEPRYQPLIPFFPPSLVPGTGGAVGSGSDEWKAYPDRLDLSFWQGDDVQVPLYITDPNDPTKDMSNEAGWEWQADIRWVHSYASTLVNSFVVESEYDTNQQMTLVTLFLPRILNMYRGNFQWELASVSPYEGPVFPVPPTIDPALWPPTDQVKTWLYGDVTIVPRLTDTDQLPPPVTTTTDDGGATNLGFVVGPNGRVP